MSANLTEWEESLQLPNPSFGVRVSELRLGRASTATRQKLFWQATTAIWVHGSGIVRKGIKQFEISH
ncbi:MAG TPA: hypothetical protein V6D10_04115 [Trichocoleus sp.]|jgi:hypothetical protein